MTQLLKHGDTFSQHVHFNVLVHGLVTGLGLGYGASVDWWSLGVLVHEMVTGVTPWRHTNIYTLYDMIIDQAFTWDSQHQSGYIKHPVLYRCST